ncbi:MAG: hypothetical protein AB7V58_15515 [Solirubrobacterales bacterium]
MSAFGGFGLTDSELRQREWLYALHVRDGSTAWVHLPLIYATRLPLQLAAYAASLSEFAARFASDGCFRPVVVSDVTVRFSLEEYRSFRHELSLGFGPEGGMARPLLEELRLVQRRLPIACMRAERAFLRGSSASPFERRSLLRLLARAIALNLANPFVESVVATSSLIFGTEPLYRELLNRYVLSTAVSHRTVFQSAWAALENSNDIGWSDVVGFCWEYGFLANPSGDGSPLESPEHVGARLAIEVPLARRTVPGSCSKPRSFADGGPTIGQGLPANPLARILHMFGLLQYHEEWRHYWQLRVMRLTRVDPGWRDQDAELAE